MEHLDDLAIEQVAGFFAAFAVPMRLKILNALRGGERNVGDLTARVGGSQANVSKHLGVLAQKGLVAKSTRGTSVYYRIADPRIYQLCDLVCVQIGQRQARQREARSPFLAMAKAAETASRRRTRR
ncbi:MAG: helix-turn-helix transcriptional regulator [Burkholderiales bacterium]|nr:helix-turn-helix transcriptional regulator [Burkholderiales bacterium]